MLGGLGAAREGMMFDVAGEVPLVFVLFEMAIPPMALSTGIRGGGGPLFPFTPKV